MNQEAVKPEKMRPGFYWMVTPGDSRIIQIGDDFIYFMGTDELFSFTRDAAYFEDAVFFGPINKPQCVIRAETSKRKKIAK